jgi:hypothetical protein
MAAARAAAEAAGHVTSQPTLHIVGRGIVAQRLQRILRDRRVIVHDPRWADVTGVHPGDVVMLAHGGAHADMVSSLLARGLHVVTVGELIDDARRLIGTDPASFDTSLVVGAAMSPGLAGLIARHLADQLASVDEIHVAVHGTAGRACARVHHRSVSGLAPGWHDGQWLDYVGGSGRELCWFPEPIGAKDCYRARTSLPLLLHRSFPSVERISGRRSARRRDRLTAWLPMLRPPHQEGGIGALRVELRGADADGGRQCVIAGVAELVGTAAAATAAAFVTAIVDGELPTGVVVAGDAGLPTADLLGLVQSFGVRLQEFTGVPQST